MNPEACQVTPHNSILAELEQDFLKDKNRPRAAQDGEGLTSKKGVGYSSHWSSKQGLNGALETWEIMSWMNVTEINCWFNFQMLN